MTTELDALKSRVRDISGAHSSPIDGTRQLYIHERPVALKGQESKEYRIKREISEYFSIPFTHVSFAGSAQIGFSVHKDRQFTPKVSDLDVACVSPTLFQQAWIDVLDSTRAFTNLPAFAPLKDFEIEAFKEGIYKRGMIRIEAMPSSSTSTRWRQFEQRISRKYVDTFKSISVAIYLNEYAFCWKQASAVSELAGGGGGK